ncbi:MAG: type II toxin-antitoxin system VapB family antitoxin [Rhodocyclaceae bacterium]|nr:type II toxin-antitoxin system VapB family antitoxin [Rhodocyclaceae bacterium]
MKTTIEISDALLIQARQLAAQRGATLRSLIEQGLRQVLAEKQQAGDFRLRRATFKGEGLQAEMRGASWERLRELAYEEHGG